MIKNTARKTKPRIQIKTGWPGSQAAPHYWFTPLADNGNYSCIKTLFTDIKKMLH